MPNNLQKKTRFTVSYAGNKIVQFVLEETGKLMLHRVTPITPPPLHVFLTYGMLIEGNLHKTWEALVPPSLSFHITHQLLFYIIWQYDRPKRGIM
jgi:hypothetical protein